MVQALWNRGSGWGWFRFVLSSLSWTYLLLLFFFGSLVFVWFCSLEGWELLQSVSRFFSRRSGKACALFMLENDTKYTKYYVLLEGSVSFWTEARGGAGESSRT